MVSQTLKLNAAGATTRRNALQRSTEASVRDIRERLTSSTGTKKSFDYQLLRNFCEIRLGAFIALIGLSAMMGAFSLSWVSLETLLVWFSLSIIPQLIIFTLCRIFLRQREENIRPKGWYTLFTLLNGCEGISWGILVFLTIGGSSPVEFYQFALMLVVIAVSTLTSWNIVSAVAVATIPVVSVTVYAYAINDNALYTPLALTALAAEVFFLILCYRLFRASITNMEFRAEKDQLIIELEQANAIANDSVRTAEEANQAKSTFLATMSHELRTPLNAILGFSEVLKNELMGPLNNEQYKEYATDIHNSGQHLLNLINEILDLSRIEAGRFNISESAVSLISTVQDCQGLLRLRAQSKKIGIVDKFENSLPKLWADQRAVRQIILNLLMNAIKFTPVNGTITIKLGWTAQSGQYISIMDTGPGIPENEIETVLSSFGQGKAARENAEAGTGLGLSIVQALIELHNGRFLLKSQLGEGTEVIVIFPPDRVMENQAIAS